jgi:hypothetical protein
MTSRDAQTFAAGWIDAWNSPRSRPHPLTLFGRDHFHFPECTETRRQRPCGRESSPSSLLGPGSCRSTRSEIRADQRPGRPRMLDGPLPKSSQSAGCGDVRAWKRRQGRPLVCVLRVKGRSHRTPPDGVEVAKRLRLICMALPHAAEKAMKRGANLLDRRQNIRDGSCLEWRRNSVVQGARRKSIRSGRCRSAAVFRATVCRAERLGRHGPRRRPGLEGGRRNHPAQLSLDRAAALRSADLLTRR